MTRLLTHPGRIQAGEIANVVKKHLAPSMNAMSEGLLRLATTVELALNAPSHSTMGSIAHDVSPTYELLKDTRNAIRLLGGRMASGLDYMQKVGFEIMEFLSRERRIGASHEMAVRKYLKSIKLVTELVQVAADTEDPGESHSFTKAILRYMSLVKSAQAEFEKHLSGHTDPTPPLADGDQGESDPPHLALPTRSITLARIYMAICMRRKERTKRCQRQWNIMNPSSNQAKRPLLVPPIRALQRRTRSLALKIHRSKYTLH